MRWGRAGAPIISGREPQPLPRVPGAPSGETSRFPSPAFPGASWGWGRGGSGLGRCSPLLHSAPHGKGQPCWEDELTINPSGATSGGRRPKGWGLHAGPSRVPFIHLPATKQDPALERWGCSSAQQLPQARQPRRFPPAALGEIQMVSSPAFLSSGFLAWRTNRRREQASAAASKGLRSASRLLFG